MRICTKCKDSKEDIEFNFIKSKNKHQSWCKECVNKNSLKYYNNNRETQIQKGINYNTNNSELRAIYRKEHYKLNKEFISESRKEYRIRTGITTGTGQSREEKIIEDYLKENQINYKTEKWFEDCRSNSNNLLFFDFFLPDLNLIIEYNGPHHYISTIFGEEKFIYTKLHDEIKEKYCIKKSIKFEVINFILNNPL